MYGNYAFLEYDKAKRVWVKTPPLPNETRFYTVTNVNNEYILIFAGSDDIWKFHEKSRTFEKMTVTGAKCDQRAYHTTNVWEDCNGVHWLVVYGGRVVAETFNHRVTVMEHGEYIKRTFLTNVYMLNLSINK